MRPLFTAFRRKAGQVLGDPVLRQWLVGRVRGQWPNPAPHIPGRPPYLGEFTLAPPEAVQCPLPSLVTPPPTAPIRLALPGAELSVAPGGEAEAVATSFADTETLLGLHRFAWLPLTAQLDPAWVAALWRAWADRFGTPDESWAWHPYTAAERAINILDFASRHGLPGERDETLALLARHGTAIARRLEYFGDHYTGNHLANNGRGLFLLGLALEWDACADLGGRILLAEAARIFCRSGVLAEGSSHYHLLLTRGYASAWLAARRHGRPEAPALETVVARALAVIPRLMLPGGLPLVGDISPDCPPEHVTGLALGAGLDQGWTGLLAAEERAALAALPLPQVDDAALAADGWLSAAWGDWAGLWYAAPEGWPPMPGHGHQDLGSFELHWRGLPLFIDAGRGAYGDEGEAALYRSSAVHNGLVVDGHDPYPPNRAYYHPDFRRMIGGTPPDLRRIEDGVALTHGGYARLGLPQVERRWRFSASKMQLEDRVGGSGKRRLTRRLVTPWPVTVAGGAAIIATSAGDLRVAAGDGAEVSLRPITRWSAYGRGEPAMAVEFTQAASLPYSGALVVETI